MTCQSIQITSQSVFFSETQARDVWEILKDVSHWPEWETNFQEARLEKGLQVDGTITIIHKDNRQPMVLRICRLVEEKYFDTDCSLPFGQVTVTREILPRDGGIELTHSFFLLPSNRESQEIFLRDFKPQVQDSFANAVKRIHAIVLQKQSSHVF